MRNTKKTSAPAFFYRTHLNPVQLLDSMADAHPSLYQPLKNLADIFSDTEKEIEDHEAQADKDRDRIEALKKELSEEAKRADTAEQTVDSLQIENGAHDDALAAIEEKHEIKIAALEAKIEALNAEQNELLEENRQALNKLAAITQIADGKNCMEYFDAQHAAAMRAANARDQAERDRAAMVRALHIAHDEVSALANSYSGKYKKTFIALSASLWQHSKPGPLVAAQKVAA